MAGTIISGEEVSSITVVNAANGACNVAASNPAMPNTPYVPAMSAPGLINWAKKAIKVPVKTPSPITGPINPPGIPKPMANRVASSLAIKIVVSSCAFSGDSTAIVIALIPEPIAWGTA